MTQLPPEQLIAARNLFGLTSDQFAAELGVTPHVYEAWEKGTLKLPALQSRVVAYRVAAAERAAALQASGLPTCAWLEQFEEEEEQGSQRARAARYERLEKHVQYCFTCQARDRFVLERFGPMPELPAPTWLRALQSVAKTIQGFPAWSRPAVWGALLLGAMTILRVLFMLPTAVRNPSRLWLPLASVVLAMAAGAVGGLVYSFVGKPLRRVRVVGPYFAGIVSVFGYMGAFLLIARVSGESMVNDLSDLVVFVALSTFFGLVVGFSLFRHLPAD